MISYEQFEVNLKQLQDRIARACEGCARGVEEVTLLPITKTHPIEAVEYALRAGLKAVGENRVQEAVEKQKSPHGVVSWELVGHLQSNKAKVALEHFYRIQSVDSMKLLERLDRLAGEMDRQLPILLQVNTGRDPAKYGLEEEETQGVVERALGLENIQLEGFMTIGELSEDLEVARGAFRKLRMLRDELEKRFDVRLRELSMGMSGDLEVAIEEGATVIRVGSALYGERG